MSRMSETHGHGVSIDQVRRSSWAYIDVLDLLDLEDLSDDESQSDEEVKSRTEQEEQEEDLSPQKRRNGMAEKQVHDMLLSSAMKKQQMDVGIKLPTVAGEKKGRFQFKSDRNQRSVLKLQHQQRRQQVLP